MSRTKILIVEDDIDWLQIFYSLVGDAMQDVFEYVHASDLTSALALAKMEKFGLILLDLMLPDSYAIETVETMISNVKHTPIIVITTLDDEKFMKSAFALGVENYLIKDQYNIEMFTHVSRQAIKNSMEKIALNSSLEQIYDNLKSMDSTLNQIQLSLVH